MNNKKFKIEQICNHRTLYKCIEKNTKGESLTVEITEVYPDNTSNHSLPNVWKSNGFTNKLYDNYLQVDCYCYDKKNNCYGKYNPTAKLSDDGNRVVINFDYLLEVSEKNKQYLLDLIYKMFMANANEVMRKEEYKKLDENYKTIIDGLHYILKETENGTCLVPVVVKQKSLKGCKNE